MRPTTLLSEYTNTEIKVQLTPKYFLPLMKTTSFLYYFSEKIISIDKIPPILQAFKVPLWSNFYPLIF